MRFGPTSPLKIAVLGAPGTGKTQLVSELTQHLSATTANKAVTPVVFTDAPPLMAAIYADLRHSDPSHHKVALAQHKIYDLTLVCGLDNLGQSARQAYDGADSYESIDAQLREVLTRNKIAYAVIYGQGPARLNAALKVIASLRNERTDATGPGRWHWACEKCSDPECEHQMFTSQLKIGSR